MMMVMVQIHGHLESKSIFFKHYYSYTQVQTLLQEIQNSKNAFKKSHAPGLLHHFT